MAVIINGTTGINAPGTEVFGDGTALGGATNPIVSMAKGANNYVQSYIINNTNGTSSSADFVAYPSNGTDSHGWVDMGITSLTYADTTYTVTGPNESYLFASAPSGSSTTGNLVIATDNTGTTNSIQFYTNGFTQAKSALRMVIDGTTGNVGIGTSSPNNYAGYKTLTISGTATTGGGEIDFQDGSTTRGSIFSTNTAFTVSSYSTIPLQFGINGSIKAAIDTSANLQFNSGYGSVATAYGCRAWVNFDGTGTVSANQTIRGSGNVSTVFKNAANQHTINFTNAMPDANYAWPSHMPYQSGSVPYANAITSVTRSTGSIQIASTGTNNGGGYASSEIYVAIFR